MVPRPSWSSLFLLCVVCADSALPAVASQAALMGSLGLAAGLLLETTLLIMRTNMPTPIDTKYSHLLDKRWDAPQSAAAENSQQLTRVKGRLQQSSRSGANGGSDHAKEE